MLKSKLILLFIFITFRSLPACSQTKLDEIYEVPIPLTADEYDSRFPQSVRCDVFEGLLTKLYQSVLDKSVSVYEGNGRKRDIDSIWADNEKRDSFFFDRNIKMAYWSPQCLENDSFKYKKFDYKVNQVEEFKALKLNISTLTEENITQAFKFSEVWSVNSNGVIQKKVKAFAPMASFIDSSNNLLPTFWLHPSRRPHKPLSVDIMYEVKLSELSDSAALLNAIYGRLLSGKVNAYYYQHGRKQIDGDQFRELYNGRNIISTRTNIDLAKEDTTISTHIFGIGL